MPESAVIRAVCFHNMVSARYLRAPIVLMVVQKEGANAAVAAAARDATINITTHPAKRDGNFRTVIGCLPLCQCDVIYIGAHLEHWPHCYCIHPPHTPAASGVVLYIWTCVLYISMYSNINAALAIMRGGSPPSLSSPKKIALQAVIYAPPCHHPRSAKTLESFGSYN